MLMGLTAAVARGATLAVPRDSAEAARLLATAKALPPGQRTEAIAMLRKAMAMDKSLADAYQTLATLLEQAGDVDGALEAYRAWTAAGTVTPLPWNRIAAILEQRKDYPAALEACTQSLRVEFNQPVIMDTRKRLEALAR